MKRLCERSSPCLCILFLLLGHLLFGGSCSSVSQCDDSLGISELTLDPNGSTCEKRCECNNQSYFGDCIGGSCIAFKRAACESPGVEQPCRIQAGIAKSSCLDGLQRCRPKGLNSLKWGDCKPNCQNANEALPEKSQSEGFVREEGALFEERSKALEEAPFRLEKGSEREFAGDAGEETPEFAREREFVREAAEERRVEGECAVNATRPCYAGPSGTEGKGTCKEGTQTCTGGRWGVCVGEVVPQKEVCDDKDNNCDGRIDENWPNKGKSCMEGVGECKRASVYVCNTAGTDVGCGTDAGKPGVEVCDGKDNDCDGKIDEDFAEKGAFCEVAGKKGPCAYGTYSQCSGGKLVCVSGVSPSAQETCGNERDDDCDGLVDEDCRCSPGEIQDCYTGASTTLGKGLCRSGKQICGSDKRWGACQGALTPSEEICDGRDNDCNGSVDNHLKAPNCTKQDGVCGGAKQVCDGAKGWKDCDDVAYFAHDKDYEVNEVKCDKKDNDCDGTVDEGCP